MFNGVQGQKENLEVGNGVLWRDDREWWRGGEGGWQALVLGVGALGGGGSRREGGSVSAAAVEVAMKQKVKVVDCKLWTVED